MKVTMVSGLKIFNKKNMNTIFIALVLNYLAVKANRSLEIHNKGDCFDVLGNQCPINNVNEVAYITENTFPLSKCIKEAALCKMLSKSIRCTHCIGYEKYLPYLISINLKCNENERVSVFGGNYFFFFGRQIVIRHKGLYAECEHKHCNYSFCCINNHPEQTKKYVQNLSSDDLLLLKWNQDCEQKQKCTIKIPRGDVRNSGRNDVKLDYKNDCKFSSPHNSRTKCSAYRMNVQYQCLPADYSELDSVKVTENTKKIVCIVFGCVTFAILTILVTYKVYFGKKLNTTLQNTANQFTEIAGDQQRANSINEFDKRDPEYCDIIDVQQVVNLSQEFDMTSNRIRIDNEISNSDSGKIMIIYDNKKDKIVQTNHYSAF